MHFSAVLLLAAATAATAYDVPANLQTFYNGVKNGGCKSFISNRGNLNDGQGQSGFGFCTDTAGVVYISGQNSLADMDVDCDGSANCNGESHDWQPETAFDWTLQQENYGLQSLDAGKIPFVVFGTCDVSVTSVIPPLSVVAVVCGGQVHYGVFGDTNGCDDDNFTGEASISLAKMCFPNENLNGKNGHTEHDVLYLAFTDQKAVPGPSGAAWTTSDPVAFEASIKGLGESLIAGVFGGSPGTTNPEEGGGDDCSWPGHCAGATCSTHDDCSDDFECVSGKCASV